MADLKVDIERMHTKGKYDTSIFGGDSTIVSPVKLGKLPYPHDRSKALNKSVDLDRQTIRADAAKNYFWLNR